MEDCRHENWKITRVKDGRVIASCADCNRTIHTDISSFSGDYQSLLYNFTEDVCPGCGQYNECFEDEETPMPGLIPSGINCRNGVEEILAKAFELYEL